MLSAAMRTADRARRQSPGANERSRAGTQSPAHEARVGPSIGFGHPGGGHRSVAIDPVGSSLLALQAQAGNAAVVQLIVQRQGSGGTAVAEPAPTTAGPPPTSVAAPPTEGKSVEQLGVIDNDTVGGGGLNLRASPEGAILTRLAHNDHVMVKRELPNDWVYVVATDGKAKGTAGYASRVYINTELPPDPSSPDPGATLHRIESGERAHDFVRRHYGASNIDTGQDQRFFTNVLQYVNEKSGRGRFFVKKIKMRGGGGGIGGSIGFPYEDIELVAGGKIWVPSLEYALALKGTVSAGSTLRDIAEKIKGIGKKLLAIPAFVAGLVIGALESIKDLFVGLFELVWGTVKSLGGNLVDAAQAIYGIATDPRKRRALLEAIDEGLRKRLETGSFLRKAYEWGRIVGYATMEVVAFILLAGATAALKAGKFAKFVEVLVNESAAIQKTVKAAQALRKSEAVMKIAAKVGKAGEVAAKVTSKAAPVTKAAGKVAGAVGKVMGAPGEAILGTARGVATGWRKLRRALHRRSGAAAKGAKAANRAGSVISVFHGTTGSLEGFGGVAGGKINVARGSNVQDLGRGFYLATDRAAAEKYADRLSRSGVPKPGGKPGEWVVPKGKGGGPTHTMQWDIPVDKLGDVVDIRPGGNFAKEWEAYLDRPMGNLDFPGVPTNRVAYMRTNDARGEMFEEFLKSIAKSDADTVIAPLGVEPFLGIGRGTQIAIRKQRVADVLNAMMRGGR
jgi:hypothetical protein